MYNIGEASKANLPFSFDPGFKPLLLHTRHTFTVE